MARPETIEVTAEDIDRLGAKLDGHPEIDWSDRAILLAAFQLAGEALATREGDSGVTGHAITPSMIPVELKPDGRLRRLSHVVLPQAERPKIDPDPDGRLRAVLIVAPSM